jgi:exosortase A-associated hydrolase 2
LSIIQKAFYLPVEGGECFCVYRRPITKVLRLVLHVPAFGDEMNKSRAMTARAGRALAERGCAVLQFDFLGCGDSSGEHFEGSFARWLENARRALGWLCDDERDSPLCLWSLRSGALLLPDLVAQCARPPALLLWQPVLSGTQYLTYLLRQKLAASLLAPEPERSGVKELRARLKGGETLEIGGYAISPLLANDLEQSTFGLEKGFAGRVSWLELSTLPAPTLSPAARAKVDILSANGIDVHAEAVHGPPFWQSVEIELSDPLIEASLDCLDPHVVPDPRRAAVV